MSFRFLHAADVHLDSPLRGLDRYESAPVQEIRSASRRAFENLVTLAIEEGIAFVVLAGDLYDGDWRDWGTGLFFTSQMARLREAQIPVFVVTGNHDAESTLTRHLRPPENVHSFSTKHPETFRLEEHGVVLHGQGFGKKAVSEDLAAAFPAAERGLVNIGVLHTSLDGREGHATYAPTTAQVLASKGYDYWALGHVHKREIVLSDPWIVFPGNVQGRHARETGPKGCSLVTVRDGRVTDVEHRSLDVVRWSLVRVDAEGARDLEDLVARVSEALAAAADEAESRAVAARVVVAGRTAVHEYLRANPDAFVQQVRSAGTDAGRGRVWVEKVLLDTAAFVDLDALAARQDALGDLVRQLHGAAVDPDERTALSESLAKLRHALPVNARSGSDGLDLQSDAAMDLLVTEARELLLSRLQHGGG